MSDDPRFSNFIQKGDQGQIVLIGCPFDFYRKRTIGKGGEDNGPCCLRRFYPKVGPIINPEFQIDISPITVSDYGNISVQMTEEEERKFTDVKTRKFKGEYVNYLRESPEKIIELITQKTLPFIQSKQTPFLIGGSKECIVAAADAFFTSQSDPEATFLILSGKPFLKPAFDGNKGTSDNVLTVLAQKYSGRTQKYSGRKFQIFGPQIQYFPSRFIRYQGTSKRIREEVLNNTHFTLLEEIRNHEIGKKELHRRTQAVHKFEQIFPENAPVFVSISLEVLSVFKGCRQVHPVGLEYEEMIQIMMFLGSRKNVVGICISEFNPSCEDFQSSLKILNLLYYFVMGRTFNQCH